MARLEEVAPGDQPSATHINALVEQVNRLTAQLNALPAPIPEVTFLDLYELTADPVLDDDRKEYYAEGKIVHTRYCQVDGDGHWVADSNMGVAGVKERLRLHTTGDALKLWFVTQPRDANDYQEAEGTPPAVTGDRVYVTTVGNHLAVVGMVEGGRRRFEMTAALTLGGNATANLQVWDGAAYDDDDATTAFTVYDFQKKHSKPATTSPAAGALGVAQFWADRGVWEIVSMSVPMHFNALAKGAVASGDATYTVDNLEPLYGCYSHVVDSDEEVTVTNRFADAIDDNGKVTVTWNASQNIFQTADGTCPA